MNLLFKFKARMLNRYNFFYLTLHIDQFKKEMMILLKSETGAFEHFMFVRQSPVL